MEEYVCPECEKPPEREYRETRDKYPKNVGFYATTSLLTL
jgi:hypothetical protein